jgi:hypothetical protein
MHPSDGREPPGQDKQGKKENYDKHYATQPDLRRTSRPNSCPS